MIGLVTVVWLVITYDGLCHKRACWCCVIMTTVAMDTDMVTLQNLDMWKKIEHNNMIARMKEKAVSL